MSRRRHRRAPGPPPDEPWVWLTEELLRSPAWRALPLCGRVVVETILLEHRAHAGAENGGLKVTYDDFARQGLGSRNTIATGIRIAVALGFVDVTFQGRRSYGGARQASMYGLTWMARSDGTPATNRWRRVKSREEAESLIDMAQRPAKLARRALTSDAMAA
jgi:hypothetical protein